MTDPKIIKLTDPQIKVLRTLMQPGAMLRGLTCFDLYTFKGHIRDYPCVSGAVVKVLLRHKLIHVISNTNTFKIYALTAFGRDVVQDTDVEEVQNESDS